MRALLLERWDQAAEALVPFFLEGADGDLEAARNAAAATLDGYRPSTGRELQLAAQIVAASLAALACLRSAVAGTDLAVSDLLSLQESALLLDRAARKATKAMEALRDGEVTDGTDWDDAAFVRAISKALVKQRLAEGKFGGTTRPRPKQKPKIRILASAPMTTAVLADIAGARGIPRH
jgi:hypothetical protein